MSFLAKLIIDGESYNVLNCKYSFYQGTDNSGKPQGLCRGGQLDLCIESNGTPNFIDWMLSTHKSKDGVLTFYRRDAMSKLSEIKFEKGFCIAFSEEFEADSNHPMRITVSISSQKLDFGGVSYQNSWKS
jgi:hypothetical protein